MVLFFGERKDVIECTNCGYKLIKPYPKDKKCPRCKKIVDALEENRKKTPKQFETMTKTASSKLWGKVKIKNTESDAFLVSGDKIILKDNEYIKLFGICSVQRTPLYYSNEKHVYLLELTNNLDFIATSILGGELDKMLLISEETHQEEKCQFLVKEGIIYIVYGVFPDKKGKWLLEQMHVHFSELVKGKDVDNLNKLEKHELKLEFRKRINFIVEEYLKIQAVFSDQDLPYIDPHVRIDYIGLSFKSIGLISLLIGNELKVEVAGEFDNEMDKLEMQESILTAKIEAIAANTRGNTGAIPRWIAVKLGYQHYRFITFKQYEKDYFMCFLCEGNLKKVEIAEKQLDPFIMPYTKSEFKGDLQAFNELKRKLINFFKEKNTFP